MMIMKALVLHIARVSRPIRKRGREDVIRFLQKKFPSTGEQEGSAAFYETYRQDGRQTCGAPMIEVSSGKQEEEHGIPGRNPEPGIR
jgi:hypothetical protein